MYYLTKLIVTCALVVAISEVAKRSSLAAAVLASVPLVSVLAMVWLYLDTRDVDKVAGLVHSIFWLVIPSMLLFVTLPILLRSGINFFVGLSVSIGLTVAGYLLMVLALQKLGVQL
ncbi:MAG: hypothetical protein C3F12_00825 [Candidatus Methylomirabilota bacterium]|nr:DUF3147 family protein [Candidatus Methylomirabilis sp.]NJD68012.1 DUF3147 family protein [candidate division NC10 bacterium]PWB48819.1 MAG: hypothetical protein C3F12_00825 [candidate division NC10 bacterium]